MVRLCRWYVYVDGMSIVYVYVSSMSMVRLCLWYAYLMIGSMVSKVKRYCVYQDLLLHFLTLIAMPLTRET